MHRNKRGLFIVFEGGEGVGKTTNLQYVHACLEQMEIPFQASREPGGTPLAERIRELVIMEHDEPVCDMAELLLIFAARAQHLARKIRPVLESGEWLVCDRFTDATYAYQGGGRHLDKQLIEQLEQRVQGDLRPDCVIVLDAPVEVGRARAQARAELDRMESEQLDFHQRVRDAYLERALKNPDKYAVIDASQPLANVQAEIVKVISRLVVEWRA